MKNFKSGYLTSLAYAVICILAAIITLPTQATTPAEIISGQVSEQRVVDARVVNVVLSGPLKLMLRSAPSAELYVKGDPKLVSRVTTKIEGNTLYIATRGIYIATGKSKQTTVELNLPTLEKLQLTGSGDSTVQGFRGNRLELSLHGSGNLLLDGSFLQMQMVSGGSGSAQVKVTGVQTMSIESHGSGNIMLDGQTNHLVVTTAGSANVNGKTMKLHKATILSTGSGDVSLNVSDEITGHSSGSGNISILGNPPKRHIHNTGSGQIILQ
ncbi:head GIN domain-containing protein [Undibacterium sp. Ji67W]